jgi:hypothetical protein
MSLGFVGNRDEAGKPSSEQVATQISRGAMLDHYENRPLWEPLRYSEGGGALKYSVTARIDLHQR